MSESDQAAGGRSEWMERAILPGIPTSRALVTGGSRGIGRAVAVALAGAGARVGIGYRGNRAAAETALAAMRAAGAGGADGRPDAFWAQAADLSTGEGVDTLFERADAEFGGGLDILVGGAGIWNADPRAAVDLEISEWQHMLASNLTSSFLSAREAARRMGPGGRIILISSTAGQRGEAGHAHYAASKGGLQSLVKSMAVELGERGIRVNAVAPGWVDTEMTEKALRGDRGERIRAEIPLGRIAQPDNIAGPVLFLASDMSRHVTGEILNVNGGSVLCG